MEQLLFEDDEESVVESEAEEETPASPIDRGPDDPVGQGGDDEERLQNYSGLFDESGTRLLMKLGVSDVTPEFSKIAGTGSSMTDVVNNLFTFLW